MMKYCCCDLTTEYIQCTSNLFHLVIKYNALPSITGKEGTTVLAFLSVNIYIQIFLISKINFEIFYSSYLFLLFGSFMLVFFVFLFMWFLCLFWMLVSLVICTVSVTVCIWCIRRRFGWSFLFLALLLFLFFYLQEINIICENGGKIVAIPLHPAGSEIGLLLYFSSI